MEITKTASEFLQKELSEFERNQILDDLRDVQYAYVRGVNHKNVCCVANEKIKMFCKKHNLSKPYRYKNVFIAKVRGGIRVIFAYTNDEPTEMYILKIDYRDNDVYGDGG